MAFVTVPFNFVEQFIQELNPFYECVAVIIKQGALIHRDFKNWAISCHRNTWI